MYRLLPFLLLLPSSLLRGQDLYDPNTIQTIEIAFAQTDWDQLLDEAYASTGDYILAESVSVNGEVFDSVGVKYKGNSSYNSNQTKNPFHIELDTYKEHAYGEYTDIKLSNVAKDPSFLREVLGYQILRQYMDAPLANYANVYVNGALVGLYSNVESVSRKFVEKHYGSKENARFDCSPPDGAGPATSGLPDLAYLGKNSTDYYAGYELQSDAGWAELIDLCDTLNNELDAIEDILDVDRALWMLAFDNVIVNLDSYIGQFKQNYYLYLDDGGRFLPTVWDLNESFGAFSQTGSTPLNGTTAKAELSHLLHADDADWPLVSQLLSVPQYKRKYLAHVKTMLEENFAGGDYEHQGEALMALIDASVQADGNKFFTYEDFMANLTTDVGGGGGGGPRGGGEGTPGITALMDARVDYLLGLSDFTQAEPTIEGVFVSDDEPALGEAVVVTAMIGDAVRAYLSYRTVTGARFERVEMSDDGTHGDGAAGDGVYGADLPVDALRVEYYLYAENDGIGKFAPQRAEHEFYELSAENTSALAGEVVVNEFMASNDATAADQDGEFDDWIELYNNTGSAVSLDGFSLSDDLGEPTAFVFPSGTSIEANGYLIVWADGDTDQTGLHADFKLSSSGGSIGLFDDAGAIADSLTYAEQETDLSFGRAPNGTGGFVAMTPTFEAANDDALVGTREYGAWDAALTVSPNPASDLLNVSLAQAHDQDLLLRLVSSSGRALDTWTLRRGETALGIDVTELPSGLYFLSIVDTFGKTSRKVMVH